MGDRITSYLLGELSEEEQTKFEEEYFSDDVKFLQFQAAQNDPLDAYARKTLAQAQLERFEKYSLSSPWLKRRADLAQALTTYVDQQRINESEAKSSAAGNTPHTSWLQSVKDVLFPKTEVRWRLAAAVVIILLVIGGVYLFIKENRMQNEIARLQAEEKSQIAQQMKLSEEEKHAAQLASDLEKEKAERTKLEEELAASQTQSKQGANEFGHSLILTLVPQALRANGNLKALSISSDDRFVDLQLQFQTKENYKHFLIEIQSVSGVSVFKSQSIRSQRTRIGATATIRIPASRLQTDDYLISLKGQSRSGGYEDISNYSFRVIRK